MTSRLSQPDTYVIGFRRSGNRHGEVYEGVVGRAFARSRNNAAARALSILRSPQKAGNEIEEVTIEMWTPESYSPAYTIGIEPEFTGDYRDVVKVMKIAEVEHPSGAIYLLDRKG